MENQREDRSKYINDLSKVIEDATSLVDGFLFGLGWTRDKLLNVRKYVFIIVALPDLTRGHYCRNVSLHRWGFEGLRVILSWGLCFSQIRCNME